jgi:Na+/melibiose symporter-like transporter
MAQLDQKLSVKEKVGYGLGDFAANIVFQTVMIFLMYFYTDIFGIPAAAVGTLLLFLCLQLLISVLVEKSFMHMLLTF